MAKMSPLFFILLGGIVCICLGYACLYVGVRSAVQVEDTPAAEVDTAAADSDTGAAGLELTEVNPGPQETARRTLREIYTAEVGVKEKSNRNDGERIGQYLGYTGFGEGYAWCAAFVSWCFKEAGHDAPRTAWSPSLFPSKRIIWRKGDRLPTVHAYRGDDARGAREPASDVAIPQKGDVFALWYPNLKRIGHAGFVDEWGDSMVITVEGNTSDGGKQEGVFRKRRPTNSIYAVANWL